MTKQTLYVAAGLVALGGVAYLLLSKKGNSGSGAVAASRRATPGQPANAWSFAETLVAAGASGYKAYLTSNSGDSAASGSSGAGDYPITDDQDSVVA